MAREAQPDVRPHRGHALGQLAGAGDARRGGVARGRGIEGRGHRQARLAQGVGDGGISGHQAHQHLAGTERGRVAAMAGIEIFRRDQAVQQQVGEPGEALGPQQRHVFIRLPGLAAGVAPLGRDCRLRHVVELRQQGHAVDGDAQLVEATAPAASFLPALLAAGRDQLIGVEERPFALDVLEFRQLFGLVMEAADVLHHTLVAVAAEALVAVGAAQITADLGAGAFHQRRILHRPGGVADHREAGAVGFLAGGFAGQEANQGATQPHDGVVGDRQAAAAIAVGTEEVDAIESLEGGLDQADRAGVALRQAVVALVTPLPDAVVGHPIGAADVVHQVLEEVPFVAGLHHHQAGAGELGQLEQEQAGGIELEMPPAVVAHNGFATAGVELGVDRIERIEAALEALHLGGLAQHGGEQAPHELEHALLQLEGAAAGPAQAAVGQGQAPDALNGVHAIAHPGIAVVAVNGVGGAGGQQTGERMLAAQHHRIDAAVELLEHGPGPGVLRFEGWRNAGVSPGGGGGGARWNDGGGTLGHAATPPKAEP